MELSAEKVLFRFKGLEMNEYNDESFEMNGGSARGSPPSPQMIDIWLLLIIDIQLIRLNIINEFIIQPRWISS